jgi:hypothetical protein
VIVVGLHVQHAWCEDQTGCPVEVTWPWPGRAYRGCRFDAGRADDATWDGDANVLDDSYRGWPLLREPWRGEQDWEWSDRLRAYRDGSGSPFLDAMLEEVFGPVTMAGAE